MSLMLRKSSTTPGGPLQGVTDTAGTGLIVPVTASGAIVSDFLAFTVSATFTGIGAAMTAGSIYAFVSTAACWVAQGAAPVATKAVGSMYVPANVTVYFDGAAGAKLAVLEDSAGGNASLVQVTC